MYSESLADIYDRIYRGRGKDYAAESAEAVRLIAEHGSGGPTLLDVACGTGGHLAHFAEEFARVEGLEGSAGMLRRARAKLPGVTVTQADMLDFDLGRTFSAITCMFAIPHLSSVEELNSAVRCFSRHLEPGGVLLVEPWYFPEHFLPGYVAADVVTEDGNTVSRVSHSEPAEGRLVRMSVHYLVAGPHEGIRHFEETHHLTLFTRQEYEEAFRRAGCTPGYVTGGPWDCGMFVGVREAD